MGDDGMINGFPIKQLSRSRNFCNRWKHLLKVAVLWVNLKFSFFSSIFLSLFMAALLYLPVSLVAESYLS